MPKKCNTIQNNKLQQIETTGQIVEIFAVFAGEEQLWPNFVLFHIKHYILNYNMFKPNDEGILFCN